MHYVRCVSLLTHLAQAGVANTAAASDESVNRIGNAPMFPLFTSTTVSPFSLVPLVEQSGGDVRYAINIAQFFSGGIGIFVFYLPISIAVCRSNEW